MLNDPTLKAAFESLVDQHHCHTVILYGSRARGDWKDGSDYDLIGIRDEGEKLNVSHELNGKFIDAIVYPENEVIGKESGFLRALNGKILRQRADLGSRFLAQLDSVFKKGPTPLPDDEIAALRLWVKKMRLRSEMGDLEGNFRRIWLQFDLLEIYFLLRGRWYLGPKAAFRWLEENDSETHQAFEAALIPSASSAAIATLCSRVVSA